MRVVISILLVAVASVMAEAAPKESRAVRYENRRYGLSFELPGSWRGFRVIRQTWSAERNTGGRVRGVVLVLRHPAWSEDRPRQDIRIWVYTRGQWAAEQRGEFFPHAGGVDEEIGRGGRYVFVTHSRDYFGELPGVVEAGRVVGDNAVARRH